MTHVPPPPPMGMPPAGYQPAPQGKGMAIASMVLGIVSIALCVYWFIALPAAIVALILGIIARGKGAGVGMAITGIITGAIGTLIGLGFLALTIFGGDFLDDYCADNPDNPYCEQEGY